MNYCEECGNKVSIKVVFRKSEKGWYETSNGYKIIRTKTHNPYIVDRGRWSTRAIDWNSPHQPQMEKQYHRTLWGAKRASRKLWNLVDDVPGLTLDYPIWFWKIKVRYELPYRKALCRQFDCMYKRRMKEEKKLATETTAKTKEY